MPCHTMAGARFRYIKPDIICNDGHDKSRLIAKMCSCFFGTVRISPKDLFARFFFVLKERNMPFDIRILQEFPELCMNWMGFVPLRRIF